MTYVAGFGGSMGAHARGLGWGASRAEGQHRSVGEGTVLEVELACMFAALKTRQRTLLKLKVRYVRGI